MSTNPGATTRPVTSTVLVAGSSVAPTDTTRPSRTPTSATLRGAPVPSITVPPLKRRSSISAPAFRRQRMAEQPRRVLVGHLAHLVVGHAREAVGEQLLGVGPGRVGVGVVDLDHDVVDADPLTRAERRGVVDHAEPEVALHRLRWRDVAVPRPRAAHTATSAGMG